MTHIPTLGRNILYSYTDPLGLGNAVWGHIGFHKIYWGDLGYQGVSRVHGIYSPH